MSATVANVTIRILDKEFHVTCPADEEQDLRVSADLVHRKMREIKDGGKVIGLDRVAVMVYRHGVRRQVGLQNPPAGGRLGTNSHSSGLKH